MLQKIDAWKRNWKALEKTKDLVTWICDLHHFAVLCIFQYVTRIVRIKFKCLFAVILKFVDA
jgi:hypothetical protein